MPLGTHFGTENDRFEQLFNYQHSVWGSSLKCRFGPSLTHSPISLTLPLSSFGWLRNNSSSHRCSASFRKKEAESANPAAPRVQLWEFFKKKEEKDVYNVCVYARLRTLYARAHF